MVLRNLYIQYESSSAPYLGARNLELKRLCSSYRGGSMYIIDSLHHLQAVFTGFGVFSQNIMVLMLMRNLVFWEMFVYPESDIASELFLANHTVIQKVKSPPVVNPIPCNWLEMNVIRPGGQFVV